MVDKKVLISPSSFGECGDEPIKLLLNNEFEIVKNPFGRKLSKDEVVQFGFDCIGIIAGLEQLSAEVIEQLPKLRCISRVGVGMDNVDIPYALKKGIQVINTPNGPTRSVAEFTLALTLSCLRKIPQVDSQLKRREWKKQTGNLILNKQIGIIGLGRIGRVVANLFLSIGNKVVGYDIDPDRDWAKTNGVKLASFDEVLSTSDILTLHIPSTKNKIPIIGKSELMKMKKHSYLINVSRGDIVDELALLDSLNSKHLSGAAIDVFNNEPYDGPLCDSCDVILTPHIGSYAEEGKLQMEIDATNNLITSLNQIK